MGPPISENVDQRSLEALLYDKPWSPTTYFPRPLPLEEALRGSWDLQHYQNMISRMARSGRPDLLVLRDELARERDTRDAERARAVALEFYESSVHPVHFRDSGSLNSYLKQAHSQTVRARLYILEGIAGNY